MKRAPLVNIILPIIGGILLFNWIHWPIWVELILMILLLVGVAILTFHRVKYLYDIFFYSFWISVGLILTALHNPLRHSNHYAHYVHPNSIVQAVVSEPPQSSVKSIKLISEVLLYDSIATQGELMLFIQPSSVAKKINYGDTLIMKLSPQLPSAQTNPYQFNYQRYLSYRKIYYQSYLTTNNYQIIEGNPSGIKALAFSLRQRLISNIQQLDLSSTHKGIVEALFLGWDNDLTESSRQQFRDAGLAHLLCVSGLHVGIVAGIIGFLLIGLGRGPRMRIIKGIIQLIGVWLFAILTGLAPATSRAALMFSLFIISRMFLIQRNSYNTLAASALILLFINPNLIYDVGFQLSYSAVLGIISLVSPLYKLIPWKDRALIEAEMSTLPLKVRLLKNIPLQLAQKIWSLVCLTLAAQLSVLPFTLYYFHQFPTYFLISNLTIVPLSGILLLTIMCSVFFGGWIFPTKLLSIELNLIDNVTQWISQLPYASMSSIYFDRVMLIALILALALFIIYFHYNRKWVFISIFIPLLIIAIYTRIQQSYAHQQQFFVIYDVGRYPAIECFSGRTSTLFTNQPVADNPSLIDYQTDNLHTMTHSIRQKIVSFDTCHYFQFSNVSIFVVDSTNQWNSFLAHPTYLYLEGNPSLSISNLVHRIQFDTLIIGANNSYYHCSKWGFECDSLHIPYHNIAQQGAYIQVLQGPSSLNKI